MQAAENPVALAEFFHIIVNCILQKLFGWDRASKKGIFGIISAYYGMVETQNRGTLHIHLLLWLPGYVDIYVLSVINFQC